MGASTRIDWCDATWNPVTGCHHDCPYCYARGIANRFGGADILDIKYVSENSKGDGVWELDERMHKKNGQIAPYPFGFQPTLHRYKLDEPQRWKKPRTIFVCSMADLFGGWVPIPWTLDVFEACRKAPQHRYLFLTKNPVRYLTLADHDMLPMGNSFWYGTSLTEPTQEYFFSDRHNTFVSIEPIHKDFGEWNILKTAEIPDWIIVGAETGNRKGKIIPKRKWIDGLVRNAEKHGIPVFMKESLRTLMGADFKQEFPWEVR